jgi:hypothetical protein
MEIYTENILPYRSIDNMGSLPTYGTSLHLIILPHVLATVTLLLALLAIGRSSSA